MDRQTLRYELGSHCRALTQLIPILRTSLRGPLQESYSNLVILFRKRISHLVSSRLAQQFDSRQITTNYHFSIRPISSHLDCQVAGNQSFEEEASKSEKHATAYLEALDFIDIDIAVGRTTVRSGHLGGFCFPSQAP